MQEVSGSNPGSGKVFMVYFVVVGVLLFIQNSLFVTKLLNFFFHINSFSILNTFCLWPIIKSSRYSQSIFNVRLNVLKRCECYQIQYQYIPFIHQVALRMKLVSINGSWHDCNVNTIIEDLTSIPFKN